MSALPCPPARLLTKNIRRSSFENVGAFSLAEVLITEPRFTGVCQGQRLHARRETQMSFPPCAPAKSVRSEWKYRLSPLGESVPWESSPTELIGAPINSVGDDSQGTLSPSGLSLYFHSDRTDLAGAQGGNDIWVSRRACRRCPWQTPVNLGSVINTSANENAPTFSNDERLMFFVSNRAGGHGRADIYLSHRADPTNDLGWETPENLGPDVNTADAEASPAYLGKGTGGHAQLYFSWGVVMEQKADIFVASVTRRGVTLGPAVAVSELNDPTVNDAGMTVRHDGKELIFWSNRDGADGNLFVSTRGSVRDRWSTPVKLPAPLNTEFGEINARLSKDGRTLLLTSTGPGGLGGTQFG